MIEFKLSFQADDKKDKKEEAKADKNSTDKTVRIF